jgi:hypothetical protein
MPLRLDDRRGDVEVSIWAVRNHYLTWREMELTTIELYRDTISVRTRPSR